MYRNRRKVPFRTTRKIIIKHSVRVYVEMPIPSKRANGYPTMGLSAENELELVKSLSEKLKQINAETKIIIYDHNWDNLDYAASILKDSSVDVDGTAFHCYGGDYKVTSLKVAMYLLLSQAPQKLANEFPNKNIHFTECSGYGPDLSVYSFSYTNVLYNLSSFLSVFSKYHY